MADSDGEKVVTMMDVLQEQEDFEEDANAVLGASDDKNCTYSKGYVKRQAIYACLTCCPDAASDPMKRAGVCLACSLTCHENHELVELYTKRNFRCDCGNPKFTQPCQFTPNKTDFNYENKYNQNFSGLYCTCHRPYPDPDSIEEEEMIQCIICEDWLHTNHLEATVPINDQYAEMVCKDCMEDNDFLHDYSDLVVNVVDKEIIVTDPDLDVTSIIKQKMEEKTLRNDSTESVINEKADVTENKPTSVDTTQEIKPETDTSNDVDETRNVESKVDIDTNKQSEQTKGEEKEIVGDSNSNEMPSENKETKNGDETIEEFVNKENIEEGNKSEKTSGDTELEIKDEEKINVEMEQETNQSENANGSLEPETSNVDKTTESTEGTIDSINSEYEVVAAPNKQENKRKLSTEELNGTSPKKSKLDLKPCLRPRGVKRVYKGATFWPSTLRQKLCTCNECVAMYKDLAVLYLTDPDDTVTAYEALGKERINDAPLSQYEKGLQALSSLDRVQQINALTEYNKMRDKLLDFLKSFKDRREIVKEEDIKAFFAGMKPKREPDGVYFCR